MPEPLLTRYLQPLLAGRRAECSTIVADAIRDGADPKALLTEVVWPAMAQVDRLYRDDRVNAAVENMACRINRMVADQVGATLPREPAVGRRIVVTCAAELREEVGAQVVADLFQSAGWEVFFVGGGVPHDEILTLVGQLRPQVLLIFGTTPEGTPAARALITMIREIGVCPTMNVVVAGGVFNRAAGLWQEVGADVFCETAREALHVVPTLGPRQGNRPKVETVKKRRRRRKMTALPV